MHDRFESKRDPQTPQIDPTEAPAFSSLKPAPLPPDVRSLLQDLSVRQIELQNEQLERARVEIEDARNDYRHLYHFAPVGFLTLDHRGVVVQANRTFCEMINGAEPVGRYFADLIAAEDRPSFLRLYPMFFADPAGQSIETRIALRQGCFDACITGRREAHTDGVAPARLLLAVDDISARKQAERTLRAVEMRWQFALEGSGDGVWDWDTASGKVYYSPRWQAMLGYTSGEVGETLEDWFGRIHPDEREHAATLLENHLLGKSPVFESEHRMQHRDGHYIWVLTRGKIMERNADGAALRVIGTQSDVSSYRQSEARLAQVQKMESLGRLASGIAHDFNNLLTVINGYSDLLLGQLGDNDATRPIIHEIHNAGERAAALTKQLLMFNRQQSREPRSVELDAIIHGIEAILGRLVGEDIEFQLELGCGDVAVYVDRHQIEQMLLNLTANARDAMPGGGKLTIATTVEPGCCDGTGVDGARHAVLTVSDTGVGMDESVRAHAFDAFFTTKDVGQGTGMGLSMVHSIVTQAGGRIELDSAPGEGTRFRIHLPLAEAGRSEPEAAPTRLRGGRGTILVVEDSSDVAGYVTTALRTEGYEVLTAASPEQALDHCARNPRIELLLTDVVMPRMNGDALARELLRTRPGLAVVYMSGHTARNASVLVPGAHFLQKPFSLAELTIKVATVLAERRANTRGGAAAAGGDAK